MIINFDSKDKFTKEMSSKNLSYISEGTEGKCYRGKDNYAYKIFKPDSIGRYKASKVITKDDINLNSFAFPDDLFVYNDKLIGCKMDLHSGNILKSSIFTDPQNISLINYHNFSKAYKNTLKDVYELSSKNILMYDVLFNIMYDGKAFTIIDTLGYTKVDGNPLKENLEMYNYAIEGLFRLWFDDYEDEELNFKDNDIDAYLKKVDKITKEFNNDDSYLRRI